MPSVIEKLEDGIYDHAIQVNRFEENLKRRSIGFLREMADDINGLLSESRQISLQEGTRLNQLMVQVKAIIAEAHSLAKTDMRSQLLDFAPIEEKATLDIMNKSIKAEVFSPVLTPAQLRAVVDDGLIRGAVAGDWWDRLEQNTQNRIVKGIQIGFAEGESIEDMKDRLLGKRTGSFENYIVADKIRRRYERKGGWIAMSDRDAEALVRTAVHKVSSTVRDQTYQANTDIIDAVESVATLDSRTTTLCASYDGLRWTMEGKPIGGHGKVYLSTPRHWGCRSTHIPVMSKLDELDRLALQKGVKIPKATRASISGSQPATQGMDSWLKKQSKERQDMIVGGKQKGELYRSGKLNLKDFTNRRGDPLTIEELRNKGK